MPKELDSRERRRAAGEPWTIRAQLPRDRTCAAVARRLLKRYAREELSQLAASNLMLIVSALANNAFVHGRGAIVLDVSRSRDRLRIDMRDEGRPERIEMVRGEPGRAHGRGLWIVEQLASVWGTERGAGHVWAELSLSAGDRV